MALKCEFCGKAPHFGNVISHANNTRRRRWNPNLKRIRAVVAGVKKQVRVCTACIRAGKVKKAARASNLELDRREPAFHGASDETLKWSEARRTMAAFGGNGGCRWRGVQQGSASCSRRVGGGERKRDQAGRSGQVLPHAGKSGGAGTFARRITVAEAERARRADQKRDAA